MIITNEKNLPEALVKAVSPEPHNKEGSISATTLKKGIREILLEKRHFSEIKRDVSTMLWALFGTATHSLLERESPDTFVEEPFEVKVSNHTVTGRVDCYDMKEQIIYDYKTTSAWKVVYKNFSDWDSQGLIYAWLLKQQGLDVKECRFIAMLKDWSETDSLRNQDYPKEEVYIHTVEITEEKLTEIEKFIFEKVKEIEDNENISDEELPMCTEEDRWATATKYAVMKEGRKTAVRVFESEEEAENLKQSLGKGHSVEVRQGTDKKCLRYCSACEFCSYYKEHYTK